MTSIQNCPYCSRPVFVDTDVAIRTISCRYCRRNFALPPPPDSNNLRPQSDSDRSTSPEQSPAPMPHAADDLVSISPDGKVDVQWRSIAEAKLAIKKIKLLKKQASVEKKAATNAQRMIRASYTQRVRQRGSKMRGGGWVGSIVRGIQTASRDADRAGLADQLAPWEAKKDQCDRIILQLESLILKIEARLAE
jgi:hypothetical protein